MTLGFVNPFARQPLRYARRAHFGSVLEECPHWPHYSRCVVIRDNKDRVRFVALRHSGIKAFGFAFRTANMEYALPRRRLNLQDALRRFEAVEFQIGALVRNVAHCLETRECVQSFSDRVGFDLRARLSRDSPFAVYLFQGEGIVRIAIVQLVDL